MTGSRTLRVLFDVSHPAHVHLFKHAIRELERDGHQTVVTSRKKGSITALLDAYGIDHQPISRPRTSKFVLIPEWASREYKLVRIARQFEPDVVVSHFNPCAAHAAHFSNTRCLIFTDDEMATEVAGQLTLPFATFLYTPQAFTKDLGPKHRRYNGYHELAYLHPNRFEPDGEVLATHGVDVNSPYFVLRFVSWDAHHDVGVSGFGPAAKRELVEFLAEHGDVYVSTEGILPESVNAQELPVPPEQVHHLLAFADLFVGDSQTMALEAGILGTPSVRSNSFASAGVFGHFQELESRYSLVLSFGAEEDAVVTAKNLAVDPKATERWASRREAMLEDCIDVTSFMVDAIRQQGYRDEQLVSEPQEQEHPYELA
jgi:hypothetical protein